MSLFDLNNINVLRFIAACLLCLNIYLIRVMDKQTHKLKESARKFEFDVETALVYLTACREIIVIIDRTEGHKSLDPIYSNAKGLMIKLMQVRETSTHTKVEFSTAVIAAKSIFPFIVDSVEGLDGRVINKSTIANLIDASAIKECYR